jgi:hypothetical protein
MPELTELSDNTFARLSQIPRYHRLVPFPCKLEEGSWFEVAMVVLTPEEIISAKSQAEKQTRAHLKDIVEKGEASSISYKEIYNDYLTVNTLFISMRHPRDIDKFALPSREILTKATWMTTDKLTILQEQYIQTVAKQPEIADLSAEELQTWLRTIIKDGTDVSFLVDSCSLRMLKDLVITLVSQITSLKATTSYVGTPQESI